MHLHNVHKKSKNACGFLLFYINFRNSNQICNWIFYSLILLYYLYVIIGDQDGNKGDIPEFNIEIDEPDDDQKVDKRGRASF